MGSRFPEVLRALSEAQEFRHGLWRLRLDHDGSLSLRMMTSLLPFGDPNCDSETNVGLVVRTAEPRNRLGSGVGFKLSHII